MLAVLRSFVRSAESTYNTWIAVEWEDRGVAIVAALLLLGVRDADDGPRTTDGPKMNIEFIEALEEMANLEVRRDDG